MRLFTISLLDSGPPFEGLIEGSIENAPKLFDPVPDIVQQPKAAHWVEKSSSFNIMYLRSNISERIAAKSCPEILH
jgi:hypothetical protein